MDLTNRPLPRRPGVERAALAVGAALVVSGLFHLGVFVADDRPWEGPLSWRKPFTFGVSFGLTLVTLTWVTSYLRMGRRRRSVLLGVFAADCVVEVAGVTLQAWRDQPSHLNTTTPANAAVAYTLAAGGAVLVVVLGSFCVTALRGRIDADPSMRLALRAGAGLLLAGLASGAAMIAYGTMVVRTRGPDEGYQAAGFLKLFHGVTLHAVLVLPAIAVVLRRLGANTETQHRAVVVAVTVYLVAALAALGYGVASVLA